MVSNLYLLFYGMGLLYNLVNIGIILDFNCFMIVGGMGFIFFNQLDLNVLVGVFVNVIVVQAMLFFLNFGFDICFDEYLQVLNEWCWQCWYECWVDVLLLVF